MKEFIEKYINLCDICNKIKYDRKPLKPKFNLTPTPTKPFQLIHTDIFTFKPYKILTVIDAFSKLASGYVLKTSQAVSVANKLTKYFSSHPTPNRIIMDNGAEFDNRLIKELLGLYKIEYHYCSPNHPASNGVVERFHSTLADHLNILNRRSDTKLKSFSSQLSIALMAYNHSIHSSTGKTPFEVAFPASHGLTLDDQTTNFTEYVDSQRAELEILHQQIYNKLASTKAANIAKLNLKREDPPQLPSDALAKDHHRSKTDDRYKPIKIEIQHPDKNTCNIKPETGKTGRKYTKVHLANIKRPHKANLVTDGSSPPSQ
ncbi:hypothetical protein AAG570_009867 [Ranatra chinensis]|uniref:Integrase catalytic domain-containing protein n=1 Tax=Ranatra chinensis TaxID=642074 RepID=A0ABD0YQL2_9HEMI